jgi:hypothetical protein
MVRKREVRELIKRIILRQLSSMANRREEDLCSAK